MRSTFSKMKLVDAIVSQHRHEFVSRFLRSLHIAFITQLEPGVLKRILCIIIAHVEDYFLTPFAHYGILRYLDAT